MNTLLAAIGLMFGSWLFLNLAGAVIVGALARMLLPGKDKVGWLTTIGVGFLGGIVANLVAHVAGWVPWGENSGILGSQLGAMGLLLLHRVWATRRGSKTPPVVPPSAS